MIRQLYVENGVGRDVTDTINRFTHSHGVSAVFQHDVHPEMQRPQKGDEWWIEDIASRGMAIVTQDAAILGLAQKDRLGITTGERQAVIDHQAHIFALGSAKYTTWQKLACITRHWETIDGLLQLSGPQGVVLYLSETRMVAFS
ncbi:MAG TPA: hypothetical protein VH025_02710 [Solirubrobacteraceae bacterium]|nr:hypothetical protein [Solirubrobacteraceae bacterium]